MSPMIYKNFRRNLSNEIERKELREIMKTRKLNAAETIRAQNLGVKIDSARV